MMKMAIFGIQYLMFFICWDIYDLCTNEGYKEWKKWLALGADIVFAVIPVITGGGCQIVKLADVADDLQDLSKVTVIGETMNRVKLFLNLLMLLIIYMMALKHMIDYLI